jgi:glycolate oxidase FAD binding subunit
MSDPKVARLVPIVGADAVRAGADGVPRVVPPSIDALAGVMATAHDEGWKVVVEGGGTWSAGSAPADLRVSVRALDEVESVRPEELVASIGAGATLERARLEVLEHGTWLPLDPPGRPDRTVGSLLATATAGPLRHSTGPMRAHVLGLTVVTGDGRILRAGATAATHGPGFDLVKLQVGGFGGFGVIAEANVRVRALPRTDTTWVATGDRDRLTAAARLLGERASDTAAVELLSPALASTADWVLAVRLLGPRAEVAAAGQRLSGVEDLAWRELLPEQRVLLWNGSARAVTSVPVSIRLGALTEGVDETLDLVISHLGEGVLSAGAVSGLIRWSGVADAIALKTLRTVLAPREVPVTLERAPWHVRREVGHFGAYREGIDGPVPSLRDAFDPGRVLVATLES